MKIGNLMQWEKKEQVVRLKLKGFTGKEIEELTLVRENQVSKIWRAYETGGQRLLNPKSVVARLAKANF